MFIVRRDRDRLTAFSLIELIIVIVIMGVISAIAIPRMVRGAEGASSTALSSDLKILRRAIELYAYEHAGEFPKEDSTFVAQLTKYTDTDGDVSNVATATHVYGPYLTVMPPLPVGANKGTRDVRDSGNPGDGAEGWFYDKNTGEIVANTDDAEVDPAGVAYNQY